MTDGEGRVSGTVGGGGAHLTGWMPVRTFPVILLIILIHQLFKIQLVILHIRINIGNDFFGGIDHILDSIKNGTSAIVGNGIQEGNESNDRGLDCNGKAEKKSKETKKKLPEEQARQYQSDVLQQAKKRNTIAFLETGAGKPSLLYFSSKVFVTTCKGRIRKCLLYFWFQRLHLFISIQKSLLSILVTKWAIIVVKWVKISGMLGGGSVSLNQNRF